MNQDPDRQKTEHRCFRARTVRASTLLVVALCGCAEFDFHESLVLYTPEPKPQTPARMTAVWTHAMLHQPGKPAVRGFGGRLLFYGERKEEPLLVDGKLTVYAFDDESPDPGDPAPEKKYVFPAELVPKHCSESALGPSYSFWLPWDAAGGQQRQLSLIARFEDASGKTVTSTIAHLTLPGRSLTSAEHAAANTNREQSLNPRFRYPAQQVSYETSPRNRAEQETVEAKRKMNTTTINVTPNFASKLMATAGKQAEVRSAGATQIQLPGKRLGSHLPERPERRFAQMRPAPFSDTPQTTADRTGQAQPSNATSQHRAGSPSTHFAHQRFPARNEPAMRPSCAPVRRGPHRGEWPRRLPPTPRSSWTRPTTTPTPGDQPASH